MSTLCGYFVIIIGYFIYLSNYHTCGCGSTLHSNNTLSWYLTHNVNELCLGKCKLKQFSEQYKSYELDLIFYCFSVYMYIFVYYTSTLYNKCHTQQRQSFMYKKMLIEGISFCKNTRL